jgi:hypothetical protein
VHLSVLSIVLWSNVSWCDPLSICIVQTWNARYYKNTNHQQMYKESFIINHNTLLHVSTLLGQLQGERFVIVTLRLHFNTLLRVSTLLGHLQGELFCYRYTKVALCSWVRMCCWLRTALFLEAWTRCGRGLPGRTAGSSRLQYTDNSTFSLNYEVQPWCNVNKKVLPEDDRAGSKHVGVCYDWW